MGGRSHAVVELVVAVGRLGQRRTAAGALYDTPTLSACVALPLVRCPSAHTAQAHTLVYGQGSRKCRLFQSVVPWLPLMPSPLVPYIRSCWTLAAPLNPLFTTSQFSFSLHSICPTSLSAPRTPSFLSSVFFSPIL